MAANGFLELLRLAKRGNQSDEYHQTETQRWSGIAFEMMGQHFVAPLGEVAEVIYPPKYTSVPNTQAWVKGVANVRGRLLSVSDLTHFLTGSRAVPAPSQKVLCVSHQDHYMGLLVDQVIGIQHFNKSSFFSSNENLDSHISSHCSGYFHQSGQHWHVFLLSRLLKNSNYMNAALQ